MKTQQPVWKLVGQLGDVHPLDYGGLFVYVDETGVYPPEMEKLEVPDSDGDDVDTAENYVAYRVTLEDCTYRNGILSDNKFHPEHPAWFADDLARVADSMDIDERQLISGFLSSNPLERAMAWETVLDYHGWENGDSYPLTMTRAEATAHYRKHRAV